MRRTFVIFLTWASALWTLARWLLNEIGYLQTAYDIGTRMPPVIESMINVLFWPLTGPIVAIACVGFLLYSSPKHDRPSSTNRAPLYINALKVYEYLKDRLDWRARVDETNASAKIERWIHYWAAAEFKRAAADGAIEVLGRKGGHGSHELIPAVYWLTVNINLDFAEGCVRPAISMDTLMGYDGVPAYTELQVICPGVLKTWPASTRWRKFWRRVTARWWR